MAKVYLSSPFLDLRESRRAAYETLRKLGHDVIAMEDYVATDQRPVDRCLTHVDECDIYICMLAWRYGYVPEDGDPGGVSVTDLEYRRAVNQEKPRLLFLLAEDAPWSPKLLDSHTGEGKSGRSINDLRKRLERDRIVSYFSGPDDLATEIGIAVTNLIQNKAALDAANVPPWGGFEELTEVGLSMYTSEYTSEASEIGRLVDRLIFETPDKKVVQVDLRGGDYWWSTRLYLLAALLGEVPGIETLVFIDGSNPPKRLVGLASPLATQRALAELQPDMEEAYRKAWVSAVKSTKSYNDRVHWIVETYSTNLRDEKGTKTVISGADLRKWLGSSILTTGVDRPDGPITSELVRDILDCPAPFVALTRKGEFLTVVDRLTLAVRIAKGTLERSAGR